MNTKPKYIYHIVAVIIVAIWGVTFISTKILINSGLTPQDIFLLRFLIAYAGMWFIAPRKLIADSWKDELMLMFGGITGGSLYFLTENSALQHTLATNVSFIVCTTPLLTTLLFLLVDKKEKASFHLIIGSIIALVGMGAVVYNGNVVLQLSPIGDILSFSAALCWAFYSLVMKKLFTRYNTNFITRKIFFYGILTILPVFIFDPWIFPIERLLEPVILGNILFLGVIASLICYAVWNIVLKKLGAVKATNYIYLNPLFTLIGAAMILNEPLTWMAMVGAALIVGGMYIAEKKQSTH